MIKLPTLALALFRSHKGKPVAPPLTPAEELRSRPPLWVWCVSLIVVGIVVLASVNWAASSWLKGLPISVGQASNEAPLMVTLPIGRSAPYADLGMLLLSAQYAPAFADDPIQAGAALVRLNLKVTNRTTSNGALLYYDIARLLIPKHAPLAPTNVHLSVSPQPGKSEIGWLDFPVDKGIQLAGLALRLGSQAQNETLVTIPLSGHFDANSFKNTTLTPNAGMDYYFRGSLLAFHLTSMEERYAYQGSQAKAGQQFYVLNFKVDNPNSYDVSPGRGFDYIRFVVDSYGRPPLESTLPATFKAGASGVGGRIVFAAPAHLSPLTVGFLSQTGNGEQDFSVS